MTSESAAPKRRGRPAAPEDKKRRHNLTFRIRGDLKEEIERRASKNGRSISEEMEFIIEKSLPIFDENANSFISDIRPLLGIHMKDKYNSSINLFQVKSYAKDSEEKSIAKSNQKKELTTPRMNILSEREGAIDLVNIFLDASRKGTIEALSMTLGGDLVEEALANGAQPKEKDSSLVAEVKHLRAEISALKAGAHGDANAVPRPAAPAEFSLASLAALVGRLTVRSPDLNVLWSSPWPSQFADLPPDTRAGLIEVLADEASSVYETMMRPEPPRISTESLIKPDVRDVGRGMRISALRRMQETLLPVNHAGATQDGQDKGRTQGRG